MYTLSANERQRLQDLGRKVAEIAADPIQQEHIAIWKNVNDKKSGKPALLARDYPVFMMHYGDELRTTIPDPFFAGVEQELLLKIYEWEHMRLHRVVLPEVRCLAAFKDSLFGIDIATSQDANEISNMSEAAVSTSKHFDRVIDTPEDIARIKNPVIAYDEALTNERCSAMREVFDGILNVRLHGIDYFRFVPWDDLLPWMNIERGMYDFVCDPDFMHAAMQRYVEASVHRAREYERLGLISSNNTNALVGAGGYGFTDTLPLPTRSGMGGRLADNWGDVADQIFTSISPDMTDEFAFEHEKEWADLFGCIYYGCCERLDHKAEQLKTFSNLRKVSLSPFANMEQGMEKFGKDTVISFKPNSNYLALDAPDYDLLERELTDVCALAQKYGSSVEIVMKTIITLRGEPQRLWKWCDLASRVIERFY